MSAKQSCNRKLEDGTRMTTPAWGFGHTQIRTGKLLHANNTAQANTAKWRGTHHDHFFRLNMNG